MKVAILTGGFPSKGNSSKSIFNLRAAEGLMNYVDVTVFHFRYWKPGRKLITPKLFNKVKVVEISLPWLPINFPFLNALNVVLWNSLVSILLKYKINHFDILHSIGLEISLTVSVLANKLNKKHVAQTIGSDLLIYLPQKERFFGLKKWITHTDVVVCNSQFLEERLKERYPHITSKVLYRGTNLDNFKRRCFNDTSAKKILYLGGFSDRKGSGMGSDLKGGESLKHIWEHFDARDNLNAVLKLGGPSSRNKKLVEWKEKLKHPERVELLGLLNPDDIPTLLSKVHIVLIPSKSEGLPNVAVEACAAGTLVVASNVGGIPEVVKHKQNGFLIDPNDRTLWIKTIEDIVNNFSAFSHLKTNAREFISNNFDSSAYPKNLVNLYQSILR